MSHRGAAQPGAGQARAPDGVAAVRRTREGSHREARTRCTPPLPVRGRPTRRARELPAESRMTWRAAPLPPHAPGKRPQPRAYTPSPPAPARPSYRTPPYSLSPALTPLAVCVRTQLFRLLLPASSLRYTCVCSLPRLPDVTRLAYFCLQLTLYPKQKHTRRPLTRAVPCTTLFRCGGFPRTQRMRGF